MVARWEAISTYQGQEDKKPLLSLTSYWECKLWLLDNFQPHVTSQLSMKVVQIDNERKGKLSAFAHINQYVRISLKVNGISANNEISYDALFIFQRGFIRRPLHLLKIRQRFLEVRYGCP